MEVEAISGQEPTRQDPVADLVGRLGPGVAAQFDI